MTSNRYKNWKAELDIKTCINCRSRHGKVYLAEEAVRPEPPLHPHCRCVIEWLTAIYAGEATNQGNNGADWWLKWVGSLPDYYITKSEAERLGYRSYLGNLGAVAAGKMITKGITKGEYHNYNGHLPSAPGRIWYEADINYREGFMGIERILFSNDGLVFVTYDHYLTFQVIV